MAIGRGLSVVPESVARLYGRQGVRYVPVEGMADCEVAVVHREDAPRSAANFARIAARVTAEASGPDVRG